MAELAPADREGARISAGLAGLDNGTDPFAAAVRATRMPMVITNPRLANNPIVFVNDSFCRFVGYAREEILGRNCRFLQGPESDPATIGKMRAAIAAETPIEVDIRNYTKSGRPFWNRLLIAPVRDCNGKLAYFFASQSDITVERENLAARVRELAEANEKLRAEAFERLQVEDALRQSQKMEAVGQLTGGLAHDFNNLLTGIIGSLELLQRRLAQGRIEDTERYITAAHGAAKRAASLTHRLLAFSRRQTLEPKPTDVNFLVIGMEELIRRTVGPAVTVEVAVARELWTTLIDPNQLENALLNLCINARDAMPDGGRIEIKTGNTTLGAEAAQDLDLPPGPYVTLCVSDTGAGMTPEVIRRAFDPFYTTKPTGMGTGLGLSMIYGFVRQSGGQARITSQASQGATICLYLPQHLGHPETIEEAIEAGIAPRAGQGETVLVVDDEPTVRMLVSDVLNDLGYTIIKAETGRAGLLLLQSEQRIDLLVTDVGLPGGMNGRQLADAGQAVRPGLKILFITGYAENALLSHGHLGPSMHVITKPFAMDALAGRIKDIIAQPG